MKLRFAAVIILTVTCVICNDNSDLYNSLLILLVGGIMEIRKLYIKETELQS